MPVFTANIPGVLKIGDRVEIAGKIKDNARKMSVNLCAEEGEEPRDVVLHYDVRFHRDNIISLSRKNGMWIGSGNFDTNYNMFVPGTFFRIVFEIKDTDMITIYCQGKFHSNFLPKIPLSMARFVVAWADIERVTHCFFYMQDGAQAPVPSQHAAPPPAPVLSPDGKRSNIRRRKSCTRERARPLSSSGSSVLQEPPTATHQEPVTTARVDKFLYDSQLGYNGDLSPPRNNPDVFTRVYANASSHMIGHDGNEESRCTTDSEETLRYDDNQSQDSKDQQSSGNDSRAVSVDRTGKRGSLNRRARAPFAQVCNFMTKNRKKK